MLRQKREAYRESLREEILDAARQLFVANGFEATSIRNIAAKVGCSPGILYHYFEDKQDIMALLVRETFIKLTARQNAIREDNDEIRSRFPRGLRAYIDFGLENPHHYALLFMKPSSWEGNERILSAFHEEGNRAFDCLRALCAEALRAKILRSSLKDGEEVAQVVWVAIHGLVSAQIGARGFPFIERSRLVDRLVDVLMTGILKP